jgi:hypothetical protein
LSFAALRTVHCETSCLPDSGERIFFDGVAAKQSETGKVVKKGREMERNGDALRYIKCHQMVKRGQGTILSETQAAVGKK